MPSEKYAARRGSVEDGMRMITACFARAPQRCTSRTYMHFLLMFQEVRPISKTRNQLLVKRRLKPRERKRLVHITRGLPQLRKLREIMEHISALFDRRCRTQTALGKLRKLRQWVKRCTWIGDTLQKVFSPNLEKALTFLDDKLLPATSNAVERGNRRHRKMQKSVYRVRSKVCLEGRIALDMIR